jgi:hypothetical protein
MKTITVTVLCLAIFFSVNCLGKDLNRGQIIGNLDQKVKIITGDRAIINLGAKNGIIKGDILTIYKTNDIDYLDPIGKCAIINVYDIKSTCEITKIYDSEIGNDAVVTEKLGVNEPGLFPVIFQIMTKIVEPYEPEKEVRVYVHSIFDEQNNITKFSEKLQKEISKVLSQKKRIRLVGKENVSQSLFAYLPWEYAESNQIIENYLNKDNIDVLISGIYNVKGDKIELSLYKVDRNKEDIVVDTTLNASIYADLITNIAIPYKPIRKERNVVFDILYKPFYYKANVRDERNNIIDIESRNNPFLEYNLKRTDFNIISPVDFKLLIDNNEINFEKSNEQQIFMTTGRHEITAVFKKGFYYNDSLLLTTNNEVRKNVVLILDNPNDIKIEVTANPVPGKENIDFKIYKKTDMNRPEVKPISLQKNNIKMVETFKD